MASSKEWCLPSGNPESCQWLSYRFDCIVSYSFLTPCLYDSLRWFPRWFSKSVTAILHYTWERFNLIVSCTQVEVERVGKTTAQRRERASESSVRYARRINQIVFSHIWLHVWVLLVIWDGWYYIVYYCLQWIILYIYHLFIAYRQETGSSLYNLPSIYIVLFYTILILFYTICIYCALLPSW